MTKNTSSSRSEEFISHLWSGFEKSPVPAILISSKAEILHCNEASFALTGLKASEASDAKSLLENLFPDKNVRKTIARYAKKIMRNETECDRHEFVLTKPNGEEKHVEFYVHDVETGDSFDDYFIVQAFDITERKSSEKSLKSQLQLEELIVSLANRFININVAEFDAKINEMIKEIGEFGEVDRSFLFQYSWNDRTMSNTHEWCRKGVISQSNNLQEIPLKQISWLSKKIPEEKPLYIKRIADLPPEASDEKQFLESQGIKAFASMPIAYGKSLYGFVGFCLVQERDCAAATNLQLLKMTGEIIALAMEHKKIEEALLESETKFRELANLLPEIVFEADLKGYYTFCNRNGYKVSEYTPEDVENGLEALKTFVPEDRERMYNNFHKLYSGLEIGVEEYTVLTKTGKTFPVIVHATAIIKNGKPAGFRGIGVDVSDLRKAERDLEKVFNLSSDMICVINFEGHFKKVNPSFRKILGFTERELLNKPFVDFIHPHDKKKSMFAIEEKLADGVEITHLENRCLSKNGDYKWISWSANPTPEEGLIYAVGRDITKLKELDEQLYKKERLEGALEMAGATCHELSQPMQIIYGYSEKLNNKSSDTKKLKEKLNIITEQIERMMEITQRMENLTKYETQNIILDTGMTDN